MRDVHVVEARLNGIVMAAGEADTLIDAHHQALLICRVMYEPSLVDQLLFVSCY